jgi:hypothetical protein
LNELRMSAERTWSPFPFSPKSPVLSALHPDWTAPTGGIYLLGNRRRIRRDAAESVQ